MTVYWNQTLFEPFVAPLRGPAVGVRRPSYASAIMLSKRHDGILVLAAVPSFGFIRSTWWSTHTHTHAFIYFTMHV